jgi:hypothetical protein
VSLKIIRTETIIPQGQLVKLILWEDEHGVRGLSAENALTGDPIELDPTPEITEYLKRWVR